MAEQPRSDSGSPRGSAGDSPKGRSPPAAAAVAHPEIEADPDDAGDVDSTLGLLDAGSRTTSLATSIAQYRYENGRTYHSYKEGSYILPNDEGENERLDVQHHLCCLELDGRLYTCPAGRDKPLKRALDAGCGTGIWAIDMADEHPETEVVGVDLSPIQPSLYGNPPVVAGTIISQPILLSVPPNVSFFVDDLEAEWTYETHFDFIYMRLLMGSINDWDKLFKQTYDNLNPGGWVELLDAMYPMTSDDGTCHPGLACWKWGDYMNQAVKKLGRALDSAEDNKNKLVEAGFVNVTEQVHKWPINTWPRDPKYKEIGAWNIENVVGGLSGLSMALFTRVLGWSVEELNMFLIDVRKDMKNPAIHGYWKVIIVSGQRPEVTT